MVEGRVSASVSLIQAGLGYSSLPVAACAAAWPAMLNAFWTNDRKLVKEDCTGKERVPILMELFEFV
jgi:hypothetical protein